MPAHVQYTNTLNRISVCIVEILLCRDKGTWYIELMCLLRTCDHNDLFTQCLVILTLENYIVA